MGLSYPNRQNPDIQAAVGDIFSLMLSSDQFTRARYYEVVAVPGSAGVLKLRRASHPVKGALPIPHPIGPTLERRLKRYVDLIRNNARKDHLTYKILEPKVDHSEVGKIDLDINFWNNIVGAGEFPWLDLPIYIGKSREEGMDRIAALLIFDRVGRKTNDADDFSGDNITKEMIRRLEPKLMGAIHYLCQAFKHKDEAAELVRHRAYANWQETLVEKVRQDEHNPHAVRTTHLEQEVMAAAKDYTKADSVLLAMLLPAADYLQIRAVDDDSIRDLRLPLDCQRFIAVQCAWSRQPVYVPNYAYLSVEERVSEEDWQATSAHLGLEEEERNQYIAKYQAWREKFNSIAALPVKYDEQVLGVLVLHHQNPYHFTEQRIAAAQTVSVHLPLPVTADFPPRVGYGTL